MSFELDLKRFAEKTKKKGDLLVRKVVIEVGGTLVLKSPVGDADYWLRPAPAGYVGGRFRANWQYGLGQADNSTNDKINAGKHGSKEAAAASVGIVTKVKADAGGKIHFITNSLPYAQRLEDGWSKNQAPNGMVKLTVEEFQPIVEAVARAINE